MERSSEADSLSDSDSEAPVAGDKLRQEEPPLGDEVGLVAGSKGGAVRSSLTAERTDADLRAQVLSLQERLEQEERRAKNMQETNKVLIVRLNEARAEIQALSTKK